jgi:hypothetical protein
MRGFRRTAGGPRRRRRRFSLNGLAIQLSGLALSFTLVALLVVTGSKAAFVEPSEAILDYVPIGAPASAEPPRRPRPTPAPPSPAPAPAEAPAEEPAPPPGDAPEPEEPSVPEVELSDSDAGTALFADEVPLAPGTTLVRCIEVSYSGDTDPAPPVLLYASAVSGDLAPYLDVVVDLGRAGPGVSSGCAGFTPAENLFTGTLDAFAAAHRGYPTGLTAWEPAEQRETRTFRFSVSVRNDRAASGRSVGFGFSWETRAD